MYHADSGLLHAGCISTLFAVSLAVPGSPVFAVGPKRISAQCQIKVERGATPAFSARLGSCDTQ